MRRRASAGQYRAALPGRLRHRMIADAKQLVFACVLVVATIGCDSESLVGPADIVRLNAAESRWQARAFADYRYEIRTGCFCPAEMNQWVRVSVRGGAVVAAEAVATGTPFPESTLGFWQPIDTLFARLRRTMTDPDSWDFYESITAEYDESLGYPVEIEYRARSNIADGGSTHSLRGVVPIQ